MQKSLEHSLHDKLGQKIAAEILEQNHYADQVAERSDRLNNAALTVKPFSGDGASGTGEGAGQSMEGRRGDRVRGND